MESNDHDILVALKTTVDYIAKQQAVFIERYESRHSALVNRVTVLENQDSRDSERFRGIMEQIQRSLNNADNIKVLTAELEALKKKSNLWDITNAIGVAIASALAWLGLK
jgi:Pyruvate/2-oxoacid:ferredoxin oxidoreductase gamma subunit